MHDNDEKLGQLRAEWQAKHDEASEIVADPNATGEALIKAEKLDRERESLAVLIEERKEELARIAKLKDRSKAAADWQATPQRTLPFSATMGDGKSRKYGQDGENTFRVQGFEDAGQTDFQWDAKRQHLEMMKEAGAGSFGGDADESKKKWELLGSFEYKVHFMEMLRNGFKGAQRVVDLRSKTLQEGLDDQGGVFAPAEMIMRIIGRMPAPTSLRALVTTLTTGRDQLIMPRKQYNQDDKYTTAFRVTWTGEIPSDGTGTMENVDDTKLLGNIGIPVHTAMLAAPITRNIIEDSAFPMQAWLETELGQIIDLVYEDMIINGTGVGQPAGILQGASASNNGFSVNPQYPEVVLSGAAAALAHDGLIDLHTALAPQYENDNTRYVMNKRSTFRALQKIKDSNNRPLFTTGITSDGLVLDRQRILFGDPIVLSLFMPDIGANNFPLIFGDLRGYYLAQRVGFSIQVLDQTKAKINQIELVGRIRFGGRTVEPWRIKIQKSNNS